MFFEVWGHGVRGLGLDPYHSPLKSPATQLVVFIAFSFHSSNINTLIIPYRLVVSIVFAVPSVLAKNQQVSPPTPPCGPCARFEHRLAQLESQATRRRASRSSRLLKECMCM